MYDLEVPNERIAIVGSSGHARVILDIIGRDAKYDVVGFVDTFKVKGSTVKNLEVLGNEEDLAELFRSGAVMGGLVAIGDNWVRSKVTENIRTLVPGFTFVTAVHPCAVIGSDVIIEGGVTIMAGAVVNPGCRIGEGCIVNTKASLDHDSVMDDYSSLAPGATTGGNVRIGTCSSVGIGASVLHGVSIGENTVVGGGSLVTKDLPGFATAYGTPARIVRCRAADERYL